MNSKRDYPRKLRVGAQLHAELAMLLRGQLADPRIGGVTLTAVDVSPDLRNARVLVSSLDDDQTLAGAVKVLNHAAGRLRTELSRRLSLRRIPELRFAADVALRQADRVSALLQQALREDADHPQADAVDDTKTVDE